MIPNNTPNAVLYELGILYKNEFEYLIRNRSGSLWTNTNSIIKKFEKTPYLKEIYDSYYLSILCEPEMINPKAEIILGPAGRSFDFDQFTFLESLSTRMLYFIGTNDKSIIQLFY